MLATESFFKGGRSPREITSAAETAAIQRGGAVVLRNSLSVIPAMRQWTAACRGFGRTFLRKRLFLVPASSPRTGYIQGRFLASSVGVAHFEQSVTSFATLRGLKPTARNIEPLRGSSGRLFFFSVTAFHFFANVLRVSAAPREILQALTQSVFVRLTANPGLNGVPLSAKLAEGKSLRFLLILGLR